MYFVTSNVVRNYTYFYVALGVYEVERYRVKDESVEGLAQNFSVDQPIGKVDVLGCFL